jgi:dihydrofolate reductase
MGRIVVTEFVSLDGVMEAPGGGEDYKHGGWTFEIARGEEGDKFKLDEIVAAEAQLLGRRTYEGFAAAWPSMTDEVGFADKFNSMPKYVFSNTLEQADWTNSTILSGASPPRSPPSSSRSTASSSSPAAPSSSRAWSSTTSSTSSA